MSAKDDRYAYTLSLRGLQRFLSDFGIEMTIEEVRNLKNLDEYHFNREVQRLIKKRLGV